MNFRQTPKYDRTIGSTDAKTRMKSRTWVGEAGSGQGDFFGFFSLPGIIVDEARV
jgi:hypothetical protein